ncbi:MAG: sigma-70 family RNA polymerase sigma factor [Clostridia bacterium]|nr:sigma-70 family RNA polymerase sigma factor [Clostridia bacterium]
MDTRERTMDRERFSEAVWALRGSMVRVAMSFLRSRMDAEDVVQDAVLSAWERIDSLRDPSAFRTWMMTIVANKSKMALRKKESFSWTKSNRRKAHRMKLPLRCGTA